MNIVMGTYERIDGHKKAEPLYIALGRNSVSGSYCVWILWLIIAHNSTN
jgi:hypothetical protein